MATHPVIVSRPLSPEEATGNVEALLALPHLKVLVEEDGFWQVYREVAQGRGIRANLVPDAHLAALLLQHGVKTLFTNDVNFRRFEFLRVINPLAAGGAPAPP